MLEFRPSCENCDRDLPPHSVEAMICSFECTFCSTCVEEVLHNVCPNCGGGFESRPILRKKYVHRLDPDRPRVYKPVDMDTYRSHQEELRDVPPAER